MQYRMKKYQLSEEEISDLLAKTDVGRLGTIDESGGPYVIAMHYVAYRGNIYLHGLPKGEKIDNISRNPKVCFEIDEMNGIVPGEKIACGTEALYSSVVIRGRAAILTDPGYKREVLDQLVCKYTPRYAGKELPEKMVQATAVIEIIPETCTGKYHR